ncbi:site-2 protease family protein [Aggregicoccus sp. 17bor-14]|uniref:site-2 protease family protein n=1 Tax=Myxococcaceae TaxID=31 RepID=UPI00129C5F72|nr:MULTISPECIES: site-2 protease family protein [Myxococcaceae]MBF5042362.1 site-2 protease family protein [Simulacricoccus sp. 17bor-14]MRI88135.1 site-2 protease family protein [Aggregicoccus sp. 17bor-14]
MAEALAAALPRRCAGCHSELSPALRACPGCGRLVHAQRLQALAAEATAAEGAEPARARTLWSEALELLPAEAAQAARVRERLQALTPVAEAPAAAPAAPPRQMPRALAALGTVGLLLWKLKGLLLLALTKGKLLLLGVAKLKSLATLLVFFGVYWRLWGWRYAAGFLFCLYLHELGHVWALRRRGLAADAPVFIPFVGAFVRLRQAPASPEEDAEIGLAGPLWGLGATVLTFAAAKLTGSRLLDAVAHSSAVLNLFNLIPVWTLDGARGFRAMTRAQRLCAVAVLGLAFYASHEGILFVVGLAALARCFEQDAAPQRSWRATATYVGLVFALAGLAWAAQGAGLPR